jgi:predicted nucleic acid-binding protein
MSDLTRSRSVVVTEPVEMEILAGRIPSEVRFRRLLGSFPAARVESGDYVTAATLLRSARSTGRTPRSLLDCLIAAVAIRHDLPLLAADRDFETIAAVSSLQLDRAGGCARRCAGAATGTCGSSPPRSSAWRSSSAG